MAFALIQDFDNFIAKPMNPLFIYKFHNFLPVIYVISGKKKLYYYNFINIIIKNKRYYNNK